MESIANVFARGTSEGSGAVELREVTGEPGEEMWRIKSCKSDSTPELSTCKDLIQRNTDTWHRWHRWHLHQQTWRTSVALGGEMDDKTRSLYDWFVIMAWRMRIKHNLIVFDSQIQPLLNSTVTGLLLSDI